MGKLMDAKGKQILHLFLLIILTLIFMEIKIAILYLFYLDTTNEENHDESHVPMSPNVSPALPLDLSMSNRINPFFQTQTSALDLSIKSTTINPKTITLDNQYEAPIIVTEPKKEWHYRSMKDLSKKHLPCLAGDGPQRTPIRVSVSFLSLFIVALYIDFYAM